MEAALPESDPSGATAAAFWLQRFAAALAAGAIDEAAGLFTGDGYWRDLLAFTWNVKTIEGRPAITAMLAAQLGACAPRDFVVTSAETEADGPINWNVENSFLTPTAFSSVK